MYKVIVVEDEYLLRQGLIETMPWSDYDCVVVGDAAAAEDGIALCHCLRPDIVITDIHMPGMNGLEMIERIKQGADCEFIIFSGYSQFEYAKKAVALGVHGYLLKPVDDDEFLGVLRDTVEVVRSKRQYAKMLEQFDRLGRERPLLEDSYLQKQPSGFKDRYLSAAISYIAEHYAEDLSAHAVAEALHISESYLSKLFKSQTGYTFLEYLTLHRMRCALQLLRDTSCKTYEIAAMVGYRDSRYFSDIFKRLVGMTPTQYRNR